MDYNVSKEALKNLITDKPAPITTKLVQIKGDSDIASSLLGENITKGALKNLITDKPAPITTKLVQIKGDSDIASSLLGENITKGALKNLVTDKPAPITQKLAQIEKEDKMKNLVTDKKQALAQGVPIYVNPVVARDTMGDSTLDMHMLIGPDEVSLPKKKAAQMKTNQVLGQHDA